MVEKKKKKESKKIGEVLGISGFTLGIAGFFSLLLSLPLSLIFFITGLIFCIIQQRKNPTKFGKRGLIINIIGLVATIIFGIIIVVYVYPLIQEQLQNFPS